MCMEIHFADSRFLTILKSRSMSSSENVCWNFFFLKYFWISQFELAIKVFKFTVNCFQKNGERSIFHLCIPTIHMGYRSVSQTYAKVKKIIYFAFVAIADITALVVGEPAMSIVCSYHRIVIWFVFIILTITIHGIVHLFILMKIITFDYNWHVHHRHLRHRRSPATKKATTTTTKTAKNNEKKYSDNTINADTSSLFLAFDSNTSPASRRDLSTQLGELCAKEIQLDRQLTQHFQSIISGPIIMAFV